MLIHTSLHIWCSIQLSKIYFLVGIIVNDAYLALNIFTKFNIQQFCCLHLIKPIRFLKIRIIILKYLNLLSFQLA
jgi:hypothetical protein